MMRLSDKWNEVRPNDATMHSHLDNNKHRNKVAWLNASTRMDDGPHPAQFQRATTPVNLVAPRMHLQLNVSLGGKAQANAIAELMQAAITEKYSNRRPCRTSPPSTSPDLASLGVKSTPEFDGAVELRRTVERPVKRAELTGRLPRGGRRHMRPSCQKTRETRTMVRSE